MSVKTSMYLVRNVADAHKLKVELGMAFSTAEAEAVYEKAMNELYAQKIAHTDWFTNSAKFNLLMKEIEITPFELWTVENWRGNYYFLKLPFENLESARYRWLEGGQNFKGFAYITSRQWA